MVDGLEGAAFGTLDQSRRLNEILAPNMAERIFRDNPGVDWLERDARGKIRLVLKRVAGLKVVQQLSLRDRFRQGV